MILEQEGSSFYGSEKEVSSWCAGSQGKNDRVAPEIVDEIMTALDELNSVNMDKEEQRRRITEVVNR